MGNSLSASFGRAVSSLIFLGLPFKHFSSSVGRLDVKLGIRAFRYLINKRKLKLSPGGDIHVYKCIVGPYRAISRSAYNE
jgi:hypothetical protein